jgi:hypothetical protein
LRLSLNGDVVIDDDLSDERWLSVEDLPKALPSCHIFVNVLLPFRNV